MGDPGGQLPHRGQLLGVDQMAVDLPDLLPGDLQFMADPLGLLDHKGQTHGLFGQSMVDCDGLDPAGVVPTCPAVQLVPWQEFVGPGKDCPNLLLGRLLQALIVGIHCSRLQRGGMRPQNLLSCYFPRVRRGHLPPAVVLHIA